MSWLQANCLFKSFYFDYLISVRKHLQISFQTTWWRRSCQHKRMSERRGKFHTSNIRKKKLLYLSHALCNINFQALSVELKSKMMGKYGKKEENRLKRRKVSTIKKFSNNLEMNLVGGFKGNLNLCKVKRRLLLVSLISNEKVLLFNR